MKIIVTSLKASLQLLKRDRTLLFLSLLPLFLGIVLYFLLGFWIINEVGTWGSDWVLTQVSSSSFGKFLQAIILVLVTVVFFFISNWTFVLMVSLLAAPFHDVISSRVEKLLGNKAPENFSQTMKTIFVSFTKNLFNEIKKIFFILILACMALFLSFIPILIPLSFIISAILLSIQFLDYNWSRHQFSFKDCLTDMRQNVVSYVLSGCLFLAFLGIPLVNLVILPFAVIYYSILWNYFHSPNQGSVA